jgi:drug/metabolite transporter (DMT)-like permease
LDQIARTGARWEEQLGRQTLGYLLAVGSASAIAATYVIRKLISSEVNPATFSVWWYGLAGVYSWIAALARGQIDQAPRVRRGWAPTLALAFFNASAAILYYTEIDMTSPALVAFFGRLRTVYIVLLGMIFLRERLNRQEWIGAGVTIVGTLLIAYRGGEILNTVFLLALVENLLMAASQIAAKFAVAHLPPLVLAGYRGVGISLMVLIYALLTGQWQWVDGSTFLVIACGASIGPFMGHVMNYASLKRVEAGKAAIVFAVQPVLVTLYTAALFGTWPTLQQAFGGVLAILGVMLVFRARSALEGEPD